MGAAASAASPLLGLGGCCCRCRCSPLGTPGSSCCRELGQKLVTSSQATSRCPSKERAIVAVSAVGGSQEECPAVRAAAMASNATGTGAGTGSGQTTSRLICPSPQSSRISPGHRCAVQQQGSSSSSLRMCSPPRAVHGLPPPRLASGTLPARASGAVGFVPAVQHVTAGSPGSSGRLVGRSVDVLTASIQRQRQIN